MCTLTVLSVLLKLIEIKLPSEQCIFVSYDLRFLLLLQNYSFTNATLRSVVWNICLDIDSDAHGLHICRWLEVSTYIMSVSSVDRQRIIQPFIGCSHRCMFCNCWYSACMFSVSALHSAVNSGVIQGHSNFWTIWIKNRIFVVFSCIYRQKHGPTVESDYSSHPQTAAIVLELLEPLFGCGHTLWIDNFFNSPELARKLKIENSTACVGTLKLNRKNVPKEVKIRNWKREKS